MNWADDRLVNFLIDLTINRFLRSPKALVSKQRVNKALARGGATSLLGILDSLIQYRGSFRGSVKTERTESLIF